MPCALAAMLNMNPLPVLDASGSTLGPGTRDWGRAAGNLEDAKVAVEALKSLVNDAVFLDEDAYSGAVHISAYRTKLLVSSALCMTSLPALRE